MKLFNAFPPASCGQYWIAVRDAQLFTSNSDVDVVAVDRSI